MYLTPEHHHGKQVGVRRFMSLYGSATFEGAALSQIAECEIQEGSAANITQVPYSQNAPVLL